MKKKLAVLCLGFLFSVLLFFPQNGAVAAVTPAVCAENQAVVCLEDAAHIPDISAPCRWEPLMTLSENGATLMRVSSAELSSAALIKELSSCSGVLFAELNYVCDREAAPLNTVSVRAVPADDIVDKRYDYTGLEWYLDNTGLFGGEAGIDVGNDIGLTASDDVVVAVVDSGVEYTHPDLAGVMVDLDQYPQLQAETGCGKYGYCAVIGEDPADPLDYNDVTHGTHVAGIIAAAADGAGISGVAQGVSLVAVRVFAKNSDDEYTSDLINAYDWLCKAKAAGVNIRSANVSLGRPVYSKAQNLAGQKLGKAGIVLCLASGNSWENCDTVLTNSAEVDGDNVITVDAITPKGEKSWFSNYGADTTDIFAPGSSILSTVGDSVASFVPSLARLDRDRIISYNGFEISGNREPDINALSFCLYDDGAVNHLGAPVAAAAGSAFMGNGGLKVAADGKKSIEIISEPKDISGLVQGTPLYFGVSSIGGYEQGFHLISAAFRKADGSFTSPRSFTSFFSETHWSSDSIALPAEAELKNFQVKLTILFVTESSDGNVAVLDSLGLGCGRDGYAFYQGTSMASPVVTASAALLAAAYPEESAAKIAARVVGSAVDSDLLADFCVSGGRLNIDKGYSDPDPVIQHITLNENTAEISGYFFGAAEGSLTVGGKTAAVTAWAPEHITATLPAGVSGQVEFCVTGAGEQFGQSGRNFATVKPAKAGTALSLPDVDHIASGSLAAINGALYFAAVMDVNDEEYNNPLTLWKYDIVTDGWSLLGNIMTAGGEVAYAEVTTDISVPMCAYNGKLYLLSREGALWQYDPAAKLWTIPVAEGVLPVSASLTAFGDGLLLVGGIEKTPSGASARSDAVRKINPVSGKVEKIGALPYTLCDAKVTEVNGKLVVVGGTDYSGNFIDKIAVSDNLQQFDTYPLFEVAPGEQRDFVVSAAGNRAVVAGLRDAAGKDLWFFDIETGGWTAAATPVSSTKAYRLAGCALDGFFYLWGHTRTADGSPFFCRTEIVNLPFTDVKEKDWFYKDVVFAYGEGLLQGTEATLFSPAMTTSRGMFVSILYRMEGKPAVNDENPYDDVKAGSYYEDAVIWAAANKIALGYGNKRFAPERGLAREELTAMLYRYAKYKGADVSAAADLSVFVDAGEISAYAVKAVSWANGSGLLFGKGGGILDPGGNTLRGETAAILHRFDKFNV